MKASNLEKQSKRAVGGDCGPELLHPGAVRAFDPIMDRPILACAMFMVGLVLLAVAILLLVPLTHD